MGGVPVCVHEGMTWILRDRVAQSGLTALCAQPDSLEPHPTPTASGLSPSPQLGLFQNVIEFKSCSMKPFQIGVFFHLLIHIKGAYMSFHSLLAHFFLALVSNPLTRWTTDHPSTVKGHETLATMEKAAICIWMQVFVWT